MSGSGHNTGMVTAVEIGLLAVVLVLVFGAYRLLRAIKPLVINAVVGIIVLLLAGVVGFGVNITPIVILLVAFGGLPAAVLVIILAQLGVIFEPAFVFV